MFFPFFQFHFSIICMYPIFIKAKARQYKNVANLLEAVNQLIPGFEQLRTIPQVIIIEQISSHSSMFQVQQIQAELQVIKQELKSQVFEEFKKFETSTANRVSTVLYDLCFVVDALGEPVRYTAWEYVQYILRVVQERISGQVCEQSIKRIHPNFPKCKRFPQHGEKICMVERTTKILRGCVSFLRPFISFSFRLLCKYIRPYFR